MKSILLILIISVFSPFNNIFSQSGWIIETNTNKNYINVNFVNETTGFIISNGDFILKTTNMGNNWVTINMGIPQNYIIASGFFTNENLAAIGVHGPSLVSGIYKTTNGGANWNIGSIPVKGVGVGLASKFINSLTGYSSGSDTYPYPLPCCHDGVLWKTTDGGNNWIDVFREGASSFSDFSYLNENELAVLSLYRIYYSTNGGHNWTHKEFLLNPAINPKSFTNPFLDTIYIAGGRGIIRSTNSGNNWGYSLLLAQNNFLNKISFINAKTGYAVGDVGQIYYTSNAGTNWIIQNSNTTKKLNSIWFINKDTGFVTGDSGIILKTFTGGLVNINQISSEIPEKFYLHQNYPNPFNPVTTIAFDLPRDSRITLSVYDISGKEITRLADNELKHSGKYNIVFNAENLASGIYLYRIRAGNFTESKHMVLIK